MIIKGLKKRLYDKNSKKGGKWIHELPHVIWGLRTQPSKATGQTLFFLVYGSCQTRGHGTVYVAKKREDRKQEMLACNNIGV
jgi:hypothetical protein